MTAAEGSLSLKDTRAYSGFSVDDVAAAKRFYAGTLGLDVTEANGMLELHLAGGGHVLVYSKGEQHVAASFTVLNFPVADIAHAVDALAEAGAVFERYDGMEQDERGVFHGGGPLIAWFKDPAGNIISVLEG